MTVYHIVGLGLAFMSMFLGLNRVPLKGLAGAAITGGSAIVAGMAIAQMAGRYPWTTALGSASVTFATVFAICGFWYGAGLLANWLWRKAAGE